jgi:high-affinity nickel permease
MILVITGTAIQILDEVNENYESTEIIPPYLVLLLYFMTALHVLVGFSFGILSLLHIILNRKALKNYFTKKQECINKEVVFSFILVAIFIIFALFVAIFIF